MRHTTTTLTRRLGTLAATAVLATALVACSGDDDTTASDPASEAAPAETGDLPAWAPVIETEGDDVVGLDFSDVEPAGDELLVELVEEGDGPAVEAGQTITADYFGQLPDADEPFDESFSSQPFTAPIGQGQLIQGWDEGLVGVPVGSRVVMAIPPELGYGDAGAGADIPGGATLYFVIDVIDAQ
jgi:peptidylprolyl isomerase